MILYSSSEKCWHKDDGQEDLWFIITSLVVITSMAFQLPNWFGEFTWHGLWMRSHQSNSTINKSSVAPGETFRLWTENCDSKFLSAPRVCLVIHLLKPVSEFNEHRSLPKPGELLTNSVLPKFWAFAVRTIVTDFPPEKRDTFSERFVVQLTCNGRKLSSSWNKRSHLVWKAETDYSVNVLVSLPILKFCPDGRTSSWSATDQIRWQTEASFVFKVVIFSSLVNEIEEKSGMLGAWTTHGSL